MPPLPNRKRIETSTIKTTKPTIGIAINLFDLERLDAEIRQKMLGGRIDISKHVDMRIDRAENDSDEAAVVFKCDLLESLVICDWIRSNDRRMKDTPTRLYIRRKTVWSRIPNYVILSERDESSGLYIPNPEIFTEFAKPEPIVPLPYKVVEFGTDIT